MPRAKLSKFRSTYFFFRKFFLKKFEIKMTFLENFFTQFTGILIVSRLPGEIGELSFS